MTERNKTSHSNLSKAKNPLFFSFSHLCALLISSNLAILTTALLFDIVITLYSLLSKAKNSDLFIGIITKPLEIILITHASASIGLIAFYFISMIYRKRQSAPITYIATSTFIAIYNGIAISVLVSGGSIFNIGLLLILSGFTCTGFFTGLYLYLLLNAQKILDRRTS